MIVRRTHYNFMYILSLQHETASVQMLTFLIEDNNLWPEFQKYGMTKDDLEFIKEQILGTEDVRRCVDVYTTM